MTEYLLGIDAGTTSFKAALFDMSGRTAACESADYRLETPDTGYAEFQAERYYEVLKELLGRLLRGSGIQSEAVSALAISSQGETLVCLDEYGTPLMNAIVWLDSRAEEEADEIRERFGKKEIYNRSGQADSTATWPAAKILWIRKHRPEVFEKTRKYLLLEDYLLWRLTGRFAGEENLWASSLLYDINRCCWWEEMLAFLGITKDQLPEIYPCGGRIENVKKDAAAELGLSPHTAVAAGALDQTCGVLGAGKAAGGAVTETTGSCLAVSAVLDRFVPFDENHPLTCQNHAVRGRYTVLLWSQTAGMVLKWYANRFYKQGSTENLDELFLQIDEDALKAPPGSGGLVMLPHLMGASNPEYNSQARGVFYGFSLNHDKTHFSRAVMESVAYMLRRNLEQLEGLGCPVKKIDSMGGGAKSDIWCQIKADVTGIPVETAAGAESACLGAAMLAGVGAGIFPDADAAAKIAPGGGKRFLPEERWKSLYDRCYENYIDLYQALDPVFRKYTGTEGRMQ